MALTVEAPDTLGETSSQGRRRMKRLAAQAGPLNNLSTVAVHPTSGNLIFPAPPPHNGHVVSSLYPHSKPRLVPTPTGLSPPREISISPTGEWITLFHPLPQGDGGTLAIYPETILSPFTTPTTAVPLSTLVLPTTPLDIIHLYPPRLHLKDNTLSAPSGPLSPPGYDSSKGPAMAVLLPDALLFVFPQRIPGRTDGNDHQMSVLRAPLCTRAYVRSGESTTINASHEKADKGWVGIAPEDEGLWAAVECAGEVEVVRIDIGIDDTLRWYVQSTPMPAVHRIERDGMVESAVLRSVIFLSSTDVRNDAKDGNTRTKEGVKMVLISQENLENQSIRTRMDQVGFERRAVVLADGFSEISGQSESPTLWDWHTLPGVSTNTISPAGYAILDMVPLTCFAPFDTVIALLSAPQGVMLAHLSLLSESGNPTVQTAWTAITREELVLGDVATRLRIALSPEVEQDGLGLICLAGSHGSTLVARSCLLEPILPLNSPDLADIVAKQAARTIHLSIKQDRSWAALIQAAAGYFKKAELEKLAQSLLKETYALLSLDKGVDAALEVAKVQIALFGLYDDARREIGVEMLKLSEVSRILTAAATAKSGDIIFDLDTIWDLIPPVEWVFATLARTFRDAVNEKAKMDWGSLEQPPPLRLIHLVNPISRATILRLLAQIRSFVTFVLNVKRPILPPATLIGGQSQIRDNTATMQAKDRVRGMASRQGIDIALWGKALVALQSTSYTSKEDEIDSFLHLKLSTSSEDLGKILSSLPDPSSLFLVERNESQLYDRLTFKPLPQPMGSKCDRCQGHTICWNLPVRPVGPSVWDQWKELQRSSCGCGGAWGR